MWWMMKAMIRVREFLAAFRCRPGERPPFITMQVHDELVLDFPRRADPRVRPPQSNLGAVREVSRLMELGGDDIGIPTPTSMEYHPTDWAEGISV